MNPLKIITADTLGEPTYDSPLKGQLNRFYNGEAVACHDRTRDLSKLENISDIEYFELSGPRKKLFFNPKDVTVGIVTCGGLCPGLNDVIRALTFCSLESYGVKRVLGFKYGYEGLVAKYYHYPIELTTDNTDEIHEKGGTILKSSRGAQDTDEIINTMIHYGVNILFTIGGDGTQRGARDIVEGVKARKLPISVVGIPKTIDNDVSLIQRSFGTSSLPLSFQYPELEKSALVYFGGTGMFPTCFCCSSRIRLRRSTSVNSEFFTRTEASTSSS